MRNGESVPCRLEGLKRSVKGLDLKRQDYSWRSIALTERMELEELAVVLQNINADISASGSYLGRISDRSKELCTHHETVGQYLMRSLAENPNESLKNRVFYRQDYLDEFNTLWDKQAMYHPELTSALKQEISEECIFYQRHLKSKKGLVGRCELEAKSMEILKEGKSRTISIGPRVIPRSSPLFQQFKIWQTLNDVEVSLAVGRGLRRQKKSEIPTLFPPTSPEEHLSIEGHRRLTPDEMQRITQELSIKEKLTKDEILCLLSTDIPKESLDLNFKEVRGDTTGAVLYRAFLEVIEQSGHDVGDIKRPAAELRRRMHDFFGKKEWNDAVLDFDATKPLDEQSYFRLWHLLYSFESDHTPTGDGCLKERIRQLCGMKAPDVSVDALSAVHFDEDYGNLSAKAIRKLLPEMMNGKRYSEACEMVYGTHSATSLTKEQNAERELKERLDLISKNTLRNPVVEKVLNQMINVVNEVIATYGRPDEIRVELARELKSSAKERLERTEGIAKSTKESEKIREILKGEPFNLTQVSKNDIIRYRLYKELEPNEYKTLYSNQKIIREDLFSKRYDIEHIIPQARRFDDSYANKTLELRDINIEKGDRTAYDFVLEKYGEEKAQAYLRRCADFFGTHSAKYRNLKASEADIEDGFVDRDLRNTAYISRKALELLREVCRCVSATSGSVTARLREDWQLVDLMRELNWDKYKTAGLVTYTPTRDGKIIGHIQDWTKRNDHRHHAMDALTVAFTKPVYVQLFNNLNASMKESSQAYLIKRKYVHNRKVASPIPLSTFRSEAKKALEDILISVQTKNKVVTRNKNKTKRADGGESVRIQLTPRGRLHEETIYGSRQVYATHEEKVNASFDVAKINTVCKKVEREALLQRLSEYGGDAKKAFTGKNALSKCPVWIDEAQGLAVPEKVRTVVLQREGTVRKEIGKDIKIEKVIDKRVQQLLRERLKLYGGNAQKAFSNLEENPIWLNKEKGIRLKRVTIRVMDACVPIHQKRDKNGRLMLTAEGFSLPTDYVCTGNNHHVAIYQRPMVDKQGLLVLDEQGNPKMVLEERIVSFLEAVTRSGQGLPIVDRSYRHEEGWRLLFTMKQNEYFVFPDEDTLFYPSEIDLMNPENQARISPHLFRVQKFSSKYYVFRHHLETNVEDNSALQGKTWKRVQSLGGLEGAVKVRVNHIGQIVAVGEY
jgi:CRISPR-associated endonuclease Csn1